MVKLPVRLTASLLHRLVAVALFGLEMVIEPIEGLAAYTVLVTVEVAVQPEGVLSVKENVTVPGADGVYVAVDVVVVLVNAPAAPPLALAVQA